ncbi:GntR family transcriptional regulator [Sphingobacterium sp. Mn56C]|uniref:GntR family transcriptional regulator n=1 Tax=Sphingobacterium sp. Mn56C TaxID=3395261 RepID=UPI003BC1AC2D
MEQKKATATEPLHMRAERHLRALMQQEEYLNGKLLPDEVGMAKELGMSRNTLRQAINRLVQEGLLIRRKGHGTLLAKGPLQGKANNWISFTQEMKSKGITVVDFERSMGHRQVNAEVSLFFGTTVNDRLFYLERVRGSTDFPFVFFQSYFNPILGLTVSDNFDGPLYDIIERQKGYTLKTSREELSSMLADKMLADRLQIEVGDPVLVRKRWVLDENDLPIEYNLGFYRGDSYTYTVSFTR